MFKCENLSACYGDHNIFSDLSFTLPENSLTALCGMNGSGKSTLLSVMTGIVPVGLVTSGKVLLDEKNVLEQKAKENAMDISLLVQNEFNIWDITVEQLVEDGRFVHRKWYQDSSSQDREIVLNAIEALGLSELKERKLSTLSGGEFQRARIARSLVQETRYIFMDEPLTALDMNHQKELLALLKNLCSKGKTICLSIHDINTASLFADTIIMMKKDRSGIFMGTPNEIISQSVLEGCYGSEFQIYEHPITGAKQVW